MPPMVAGVAIDGPVNHVPVEGQTVGGRDSEGTAEVYELRAGHVHLTAHVTRWRSGVPDIQINSRNRSPEAFDGIVRRLRLGIYPLRRGSNLRWVELRVAGGDLHRPTRRKATILELSRLVGENIEDTLTRLGAQEVDTRRVILDDESNRKNILLVTFPAENSIVPLAAFTVTTVLPMIRQGSKG